MTTNVAGDTFEGSSTDVENGQGNIYIEGITESSRENVKALPEFCCKLAPESHNQIHESDHSEENSHP